jgi:WD40 repeat protein
MLRHKGKGAQTEEGGSIVAGGFIALLVIAVCFAVYSYGSRTNWHINRSVNVSGGTKVVYATIDKNRAVVYAYSPATDKAQKIYELNYPTNLLPSFSKTDSGHFLVRGSQMDGKDFRLLIGMDGQATVPSNDVAASPPFKPEIEPELTKFADKTVLSFQLSPTGRWATYQLLEETEDGKPKYPGTLWATSVASPGDSVRIGDGEYYSLGWSSDSRYILLGSFDESRGANVYEVGTGKIYRLPKGFEGATVIGLFE